MANVIIFTNENGGTSVCMPTGNIPIEEVQAQHIPIGVQSFIVDAATLPIEHDVFFNAWEQTSGVVTVNIDKAWVIAHVNRRVARAEEFKPYDEIIMKQIPGSSAVEAEAARQAIRDRYAAMQTAIDAATTVDEIKTVMPQGA